MDLAIRILGGLIRAGLGPFLQDVVAKGWLSESDATAAVWGISGVIVAGAWSAWQKWQHHDEVAALRGAIAFQSQQHQYPQPPPDQAA